jgi:predicted Zn-dependent peptidase
MKLLQEFKNEYNNITYRLYELDCGIKLIHLENPITINFDFYTIQKAGSIYEEMERIPHGSAHLLEHMLMNPNTTFKTQDDIEKFEEGDKKRPALNINAATSHKFINLNGRANENGAERILQRIKSTIDFPYSKFKRSIINEKKIVTAERSRRPKLQKDNFRQKMFFLQGKVYPEFSNHIIGEIEDIEKISLKHLEKLFNQRLITKDAIFSIQSNTVLSNSIFTKLEDIGNKFLNEYPADVRDLQLINKLDFGYFYDEKATGTTIELNFFDHIGKGFDYRKEALDNVLNSVIRRIGFLLLREKQGLIYSLQIFRENWFTVYHNVGCLRFSVENSRIEELFVKLDSFLLKDIEKFIKSDRGTRWINNILSIYIYPNTIIYNEELPYNVAMDYAEYGNIYNYTSYVEAVKKITKADLLNELKKLQSTPPHIWVESNLPKKEVEKIVKESSLWKRFK